MFEKFTSLLSYQALTLEKTTGNTIFMKLKYQNPHRKKLQKNMQCFLNDISLNK